MNNTVFRTINVPDAWQALSATRLVCSGTLSAPTTNAGNVLVRSKAEATQQVILEPGEWHDFQSVNLAGIEVCNESAGDTNAITFVGGTW